MDESLKMLMHYYRTDPKYDLFPNAAYFVYVSKINKLYTNKFDVNLKVNNFTQCIYRFEHNKLFLNL